MVTFNIPEPKYGIVNCIWEIDAPDQAEAVKKMVGYLRELNTKFSQPPSPLPTSRNPFVIGKELMIRLGNITDPIAFVITLHLFVEYWLNRILEKYFPHADLTKFNFSHKLTIVYSAGHIPKNLYENITKLNTLRNQIAHKINFDFRTMDLQYHDFGLIYGLSKFKPSYDPNAKQNHISNILNGILGVTYSPLHNHCRNVLGFKKKKKGKRKKKK